MFNISLGELLVIIGVACLVFKPEELPALANKVGQFMAKGRDKITELRNLFFKTHE